MGSPWAQSVGEHYPENPWARKLSVQGPRHRLFPPPFPPQRHHRLALVLLHIHYHPLLSQAGPLPPHCLPGTAFAASLAGPPETPPQLAPQQGRHCSVWFGAQGPSRQLHTVPVSTGTDRSRSGSPRPVSGLRPRQLRRAAYRNARIGADSGASHHNHLPSFNEGVRYELQRLAVVGPYRTRRHRGRRVRWKSASTKTASGAASS